MPKCVCSFSTFYVFFINSVHSLQMAWIEHGYAAMCPFFQWFFLIEIHCLQMTGYFSNLSRKSLKGVQAVAITSKSFRENRTTAQLKTSIKSIDFDINGMGVTQWPEQFIKSIHSLSIVLTHINRKATLLNEYCNFSKGTFRKFCTNQKIEQLI